MLPSISGPASAQAFGRRTDHNTVHHEGWQAVVNGQRVSIETFVSLLPPDLMARRVAQSRAVYQRFLVGDSRILLSGLQDGVHWVAEITGHPEGSQGYVSALYFDPASVDPSVAAHRMSAADQLTRIVPLQVKHTVEFDSGVLVARGAFNGDTMKAPNGKMQQSSQAASLEGKPQVQLLHAGSHTGQVVAIVLPEK